MIHYKKFSLTTDGSGDGTDTQDIHGEIKKIVTDSTAADSSTTDATWTIAANAYRGEVGETLLTLTNLGDNSAVDYPLKLAQDVVGTDVGGAFVPFVALGPVTLTIAQGGATKAHSGMILYEA